MIAGFDPRKSYRGDRHDLFTRLLDRRAVVATSRESCKAMQRTPGTRALGGDNFT
jgi:hypothetical protein